MTNTNESAEPDSGNLRDKTLADQETSQRIAKLDLEQRQLRFQTSRQGRSIEWLKALTGLAAIAGLVITFWSADRQFTQLAISRNEDRFDRAASKLGSNNAAERLAGISALQLFLDPSDTTKQRATLLFLVNAVAIEQDSTVRGAIIDTFTSLSRYRVPQQVLDETLIAARDRNRGILASLRAQFMERVNSNGKLLFEKGNDEAWMGKRSEAELAPLKATAAAIAALIRNGAYAKDLSRIYCVSCDFHDDAKSINLSNTRFDGSFLRLATFKNVQLERASFDGAYLMQTDFTNANLRTAKLTAPPLVDPPIQAILVQKVLWASIGPIFECADLSDADFTGSVLFGFYWTNINGAGYFPRFYGANIHGTNFKNFIIFTAVPQRVAIRKSSRPAVYRDALQLASGQSGAYDVPIKGWGKGKDFIQTYSIGENFKFTGPIPRQIWPSMYAALNSLMSAKNLSESQMPEGLRQFLDANKASLSQPIISTTCPAKAEP